MNTVPQATLLCGAPETVRAQAHLLMKQALCKEHGCTSCLTCQMPQIPQHYALWITPEKKYTLDVLEPIAHKIMFALQDGEQFFFVLEKADLLTPACANSLLKVVEEPPRGYHFLFLAQQPQLVIPTIRSRCHIVYTQTADRAALSNFLRYFMGHTNSAALFLKELQTDCPEDYETPACLDLLMHHWSQEHVRLLIAGHRTEADRAHALLTLFQHTAQRPPMPGSAKLFWRDLFMRKGLIL